MLEVLASMLIAAAEPSASCVAAAHRYMGFLVEEAKGTRHEEQIARSIAAPGGKDGKALEIAAGLSADQCALILAAPDSTLRAMAIAALPERNGK